MGCSCSNNEHDEIFHKAEELNALLEGMDVMDCFAILGMLQVDVLICLREEGETFKQARAKIVEHIHRMAHCTEKAIDRIIENEEKGIVIS